MSYPAPNALKVRGIGRLAVQRDIAFHPAIQDVAAQPYAKPAGRTFDLAQLPFEVAPRSRNRHHATRRAVPDHGLVQFRHADVEAMTQLLLQRTDHLAAVFE